MVGWGAHVGWFKQLLAERHGLSGLSPHPAASLHAAAAIAVAQPLSLPPLNAGEHWWRDNGGNFTVPLPGSRQQKTRDRTHSFDDELRWATWGPAEPGVGTSVCGLDACA
jgi:hypothetical protein